VRTAGGKLGIRADGRLLRSGSTAQCPELPCSLKVTCSGLGGDLAVFNGETCVPFAGEHGGCAGYPQWNNASTTAQIIVYALCDAAEPYEVVVRTQPGCEKRWRGGAGPCDPAGAYAEHACDNTGCTTSATCRDSVGASCVVS
jgi:hypothetical protein